MDEDEDDSFNRPILPFKSVQPSTVPKQKVPEKEDSPDSDDSFDTFQPSQLPPPPAKTPIFSNLSIQATQKLGGFSNLTQASSSKAATPPNQVQVPAKPIPKAALTSQKPPTPVPVTRPLHPKPTNSSTPANLKSANTSFTRHRSDNSFLPPPQVIGSQKNTPIMQKTSPLLLSNSQRPPTPSGETLMLRAQLENEKKEKAKMTTDWQKTTKEMTEKHNVEVEELKKKCEQMRKEMEALKASAAIRQFNNKIGSPAKPSTDATPTPPHQQNEIRRVAPSIPSQSGGVAMKKPMMRPNAGPNPNFGKSGVTPRRTVQPLSAFRHDRIDTETTFELEESFEPTATSTPRTGHVFKGIGGLRRPFELKSPAHLYDDFDRGAPLAKRKCEATPRRKLTKEEIREKSRAILKKLDASEMFVDLVLGEDEEECAKESSKKPEDSLIDYDDLESGFIDSYLVDQLYNSNARKKREKLSKSTKNKFKDPVFTLPTCSKCHVSEVRQKNREMEEIDRDKSWKKAESARIERELKDAEAPVSLMYSTMLQSLNRLGMSEVERMRTARAKAEIQLDEKKEKIIARELEDIQNEVKEQWKSEISEELQQNGELRAEIGKRPEECSSAAVNDDNIWTSDSDDEDFHYAPPYNYDKWTLCTRCARRQQVARRIVKRNRMKTEIVLDAFEEYGKEQREQLRNMSILTKSKIEAADKELNLQMNELIGGENMDEDFY